MHQTTMHTALKGNLIYAQIQFLYKKRQTIENNPQKKRIGSISSNDCSLSWLFFNLSYPALDSSNFSSHSLSIQKILFYIKKDILILSLFLRIKNNIHNQYYLYISYNN